MTGTVHDVRLDHDRLVLGDAIVTFQRTLRIPEHGVHPLPPGLSRFPLRRVADYPDTAPPSWLDKGGVMLPVYQREAMWLSFSADVPSALKIGVGKVCAVSGRPWSNTLSQDPQNYVAVPLQPWLDGINSGDGTVRQFVAVRHGLAATVEGQVTGEETHGGVQLAVHALTPAARTRWEERPQRLYSADYMVGAAAPMSADMGIGAGGTMRQEIYDDERPVGDYEPNGTRIFVHPSIERRRQPPEGPVPASCTRRCGGAATTQGPVPRARTSAASSLNTPYPSTRTASVGQACSVSAAATSSSSASRA